MVKVGVDHQRQAVLMRDRRDRGDVEHVEAGIAQGLGKQGFGVGPDRRAPGIQVARFDEGGFDAEARQGVVQQVVRAAVERAGGDDMRAGAGDGGEPECSAAWPQAVAMPATPPSSAAMRSSSTALVGLEMREYT